VWVANTHGNNLSELTAASGYTMGLSFMPFSETQGQFAMALDASGKVWVANNYGDTVSQFIGLANPVLTPIQACLAKGLDVCAP
jgi:DNA-binding beta-propeller fold protein YncE